MDLQQLHTMGAFVSQRPIKRTFEANRPLTKDAAEWTDPEVPEFTGETERVSFDVFIKRLSSADEIAIAQAAPDERTFVMIHRLTYNEYGERLFESVEQVQTLSTWLLVPLIDAIEGVASRAPKKLSTSAIPSGSKSRSRSVGAHRKSGKKQ